MKNSKNKIYDEKPVSDFKQLVESCTKDYGARTAFTVKDSSKRLHDISFEEFYQDIRSLGTALINLGLSNAKIAIISAARYEWCTSYFSIATSGNIIVPLDHLLPNVELTTLIKESEVNAIIFDKKYMNFIKELILTGQTHLKYCICME